MFFQKDSKSRQPSLVILRHVFFAGGTGCGKLTRGLNAGLKGVAAGGVPCPGGGCEGSFGLLYLGGGPAGSGGFVFPGGGPGGAGMGGGCVGGCIGGAAMGGCICC